MQYRLGIDIFIVFIKPLYFSWRRRKLAPPLIAAKNQLQKRFNEQRLAISLQLDRKGGIYWGIFIIVGVSLRPSSQSWSIFEIFFLNFFSNGTESTWIASVFFSDEQTTNIENATSARLVCKSVQPKLRVLFCWNSHFLYVTNRFAPIQQNAYVVTVWCALLCLHALQMQ